MRKIGFDNDQYVRLQSERIRQRINKFGGKLYLEFGGKLFDDFHASRVLPGFRPDSKIRMLMEMKAESEVIVAISADDIERNKRRGDLGITYDMEALRLIDAFRACGLYVGGVCITHCREQDTVSQFQKRLEALNVPVYRHYIIPDYPANLPLIVSPDGFGKSDFIETTRPLVVVTAKWRRVFPSSIITTSAASAPGMRSLRRSRSGIFRSTTRSTLPTKRRPPIWTM